MVGNDNLSKKHVTIPFLLNFISDLDDDLADVMAALEPVAARWRDIGIMFRLKAGDLDTIGASHPGNPSDCMFDVDVYWLEQRYNVGRFGPPTWRKIVEAIWKSAGGGNPDHAWKIAQAHSMSYIISFCIDLVARPPPS